MVLKRTVGLYKSGLGLGLGLPRFPFENGMNIRNLLHFLYFLQAKLERYAIAISLQGFERVGKNNGMSG